MEPNEQDIILEVKQIVKLSIDYQSAGKEERRNMEKPNGKQYAIVANFYISTKKYSIKKICDILKISKTSFFSSLKKEKIKRIDRFSLYKINTYLLIDEKKKKENTNLSLDEISNKLNEMNSKINELNNLLIKIFSSNKEEKILENNFLESLKRVDYKSIDFFSEKLEYNRVKVSSSVLSYFFNFSLLNNWNPGESISNALCAYIILHNPNQFKNEDSSNTPKNL